MSQKILIFAFVAALQINAIFSQCINNGYNYVSPSNYIYQGNYGNSINTGNCNNFGSGLVGIASGNTQATGLSIYSENEISGPITVTGSLPFAAAVSFDGSVPSNGEANVQTGCGSTVALNSAGLGAGSNYATGNSYGLGNTYVQNPGLVQSSGLAGNQFSGYNGVVGLQQTRQGCGCAV